MPENPRVYGVRVRANRPHEDREYYTRWGGQDVVIDLLLGPGPADVDPWVICGDAFIKNLHRACGEYLVKKAHDARR